MLCWGPKHWGTDVGHVAVKGGSSEGGGPRVGQQWDETAVAAAAHESSSR